ncbi:MAG: hypothetical protein ACJ75J_18415 [Cytophagaceae bacterium]
MNRVTVIFSALLLFSMASYGQYTNSVKVIQIWKIAVTKEADVWTKTKEVNSLESARWNIRQDSMPALQILGSPGIRRLISDKHAQIKVAFNGSEAPVFITRDKMLDALMRQINDYSRQKKIKDQATLISGMESSMRKEAAVLYEEPVWAQFMANKSFDSILIAYDKYVVYQLRQMKMNPKDSLSQKNYAKDSTKYMGMAKRVRATGEKAVLAVDREQYEEIKNKNKIASSKFRIPSVTYYFDISSLTKTRASWSPVDISVTLEKKVKPFMYITFDTLVTIIPASMPIADSALCETDLIGEDIKAAIDVKKYTPCSSAAGFPCNTNYTPSFWEKKSFSITFSKNGVQEIPGSLEPAHQYLKSNQLELKKVSINAFASVEGDTEKNLILANERANVMVKVMKSYERDSVDADINCAENWKDFYKDLPRTPFAQQWKDLDTLKLKAVINDSTNAQTLEPWLRNHRYANLEVFGQKRMTEKEKSEKIKGQYDAYVNSLKTSPEIRKPLWEQKIAAMRGWVVKEYLGDRMKKHEAEEYFKVMTPGLQIADFYMQSKVLSSDKEFLGAGKEEWFLNTMKAALTRRDSLISDINTLPADKFTQKSQAELALDMNMDFLRQCTQVMIYSVRKGKIASWVYDSLYIPPTEDFIPLNVLISYAKANNNASLNNKPGGASIQFYEEKVANSSRYIKDYSLARCYGNIYCIDHPYYRDLRNSVLTPKKMTEGNKELMKKVALIFYEVQLSETDAVAGKYYDLDIFKVKELGEKLSVKGLCKIEKDKFSLEANKKAAIFRFYQDDVKNTRTTELDALCAYYVRQKAFATPELVERLARMLLWFDKESSASKDNLNKAQEFMRRMGVETDKRFKSLRPFMDRINILALKSTLVEK